MDEASRRSVDAWLYPLLLVTAVLAAAVAWVESNEQPTPEPAAAAPRSSRAASSDDGTDVGGLELLPAPRPAAGSDFVPDLPPVPDLATDPPPPRPTGATDPRFLQLAVEMRLISRARERLAEHPADALGILRQHRRAHPDGILREERDAFAIEALLALEHVEEAERRYYDFRRDYPDSDFLERLGRSMQREPHSVGVGGR